MDFDKIYMSLQEMFPLVDIRILKAVAIEHAKDLNAAIDCVLFEVVPNLPKKPISPVTLQENQHLAGRTDGESLCEDQSMMLQCHVVDDNTDVRSSSTSGSLLFENGSHLDQPSGLFGQSSSSLYAEALDFPVQSDKDEDDGLDCEDSESGLIRSSRNGKDVEVNVGQNETSSETLFASMQASDAGVFSSLSKSCEGQDGFDGYIASGLETVSYQKSYEEEPSLDSTPLKVEDSVVTLVHSSENQVALTFCPKETPSLDNTPLEVGGSEVGLVLCSNQEHTPDHDVLDYSLRSVNDYGLVVAHGEKPEEICSVNLTVSQGTSVNEMFGDEEGTTSNTSVTRSAEICSVDFLEEIIEDAKSNKRQLFDAMESVISTMREVELKEKDAEEAKEEAARAGLDILSETEELKKILRQAKDLNDMHAGEVYGEKSILATEARELQSRLLNLADERDKSLAVLNELNQTLQARLAKANEEMMSAQMDKLCKEEVAQEKLTEQKAIMAKVVQESEMLQQEAEENSKLREFLVDRGRVVDTLQGEISVICQDVRLLKERIDDRVLLSKSLSSSQTSCILASSSSSEKSVASIHALEQHQSSESTKKKNSVGGQSPKHSPVDNEAPLDDGWDFLENGDDA